MLRISMFLTKQISRVYLRMAGTSDAMKLPQSERPAINGLSLRTAYISPGLSLNRMPRA